MIEVYRHDANGVALSGNLSDLVSAALNGKNIKCMVVDAEGHTELFSFERVIVSNLGHVYGVTPLRLANFDVNANHAPSFSYYANAGVAVFGTHGKEVVKVNTNTYVNPMEMRWLTE